MGASDYMTGSAPSGASYAAPLVGFALGQQIADLPGAYMQGREMKRLRAAQQPIIDPNTGQPTEDPNTIIRQRLGLGGDYAERMLPFLYGNQLREERSRLQPPSMGNDEPQGTPPPFAPRVGQPQGQAQPQPRLAAAGGDTGEGPGAPNIRSLVTELAGGREAGSTIRDAVQQFRISPDADLSPEQAKAITAFAGPKLRGGGPSADASADAGPSGGMGGAPAPTGGVAPNAVAQAGGGTANVDAAGGDGGPPSVAQKWDARQRAAAPDQATGLPQGYTENTAANWYNYGRQLSNLSGRAALTGNKAEADQAKSEADHAFSMAQKIRDAIKDKAAFTGPMKEARDAPVQAQKIEDEVRKGDIATGEKTFKGLQEAGTAGRLGNEKLDVIRTQMSNPDFFSGAGNELVKKFQQWSVTLGGNPRAAEPMEEFHKTALDLLNEQIRSMAAGGVSRIQLAEINNLKQSIASLGISPASNRYLAEEMYRIHKANVDIAGLAREYRARHQYLDSGWETVRDRYYAQHPLFSKNEIADPRLIAPPYLPLAVNGDPAKKAQWARNQGIKKGEPYLADGPDPRLPRGPDNVRHLRAW